MSQQGMKKKFAKFDFAAALDRIADQMESGHLLLASGPDLFLSAIENRMKLLNAGIVHPEAPPKIRPKTFMEDQYSQALEIINEQREEIERLRAPAATVTREEAERLVDAVIQHDRDRADAGYMGLVTDQAYVEADKKFSAAYAALLARLQAEAPTLQSENTPDTTKDMETK